MRKKVHEVRQKILSHIVEGNLVEQRQLPSVRAFEDRIGCSRQTVHHALLELVEAGVLDVAPRSGFRVCNFEQARGLLGPVTDMRIAFIMPRWIDRGIVSPLFAEIMYGAESAGGMETRLNLVCLTLPWESTEKRFSFTRLALSDRGIAGAMLVGPTPDFIAEKFLTKCPVPAVLVDNITDLPGTTCISKDNLSGAARAVRYLIERGHRRIGMISVTPRKMRLNERWAGFQAEMHRHNLLGEIPFVEETAWDADTVSGGAAAVESLLRRGLSGATALLALNDNMALGAIQAFQKHGIRVPEDISVVGIGNDSNVLKLCIPCLTTVTTDCRRLGKVAMQALLDSIRHPKAGGKGVMLLPMELLEGDSVCDGPFAKIQCSSLYW